MRFVALFFLFFYANVAALTASTIVSDSSLIQVRNYSEESIAKFLEQKEYNYDLDPKYEKNPLKRLWRSFIRKLTDRLGQGTISIVWEIIKYSLIIFGVFILGRFLLRSSKTSYLKRSDRSPDFIGALVKSEAGEKSLLHLINEAERSDSYEEAVRYRFIHLLREMDKASLISWADHKSNYDYASELKERDLRADFRGISSVFEHLVYGNFQTSLADYTSIKQDFERFHDNLKSAAV